MDTKPQHIDGPVLEDILQGWYNSCFDHRFIVDCRFAYEYQGGHIQGAENCWTEEMAHMFLFCKPPLKSRNIVVLYCEYSESRAQRM
jgi:rhodanese-related sulfurtransferase